MKIDTSNKGHARLSASKTKLWTICPGQPAWVEANPVEEETSEYAMLGTCAHALIERCLEKGEYPEQYEDRVIKIIDPDTGSGTSILRKGAKLPTKVGEVAFIVDMDMIEATTKMVEYIHDRCYLLGLTKQVSAKDVAALVKKGIVRLEVKVNPLPDRDDTGGSGDVVIDAWPELIEIVDYKNGQGVFVPITKNEQTMSYLLGSMIEVGAMDYAKAVHTICQPRHPDAPSNGIMSEEVDPAFILEWQKWLEERAFDVDHCRGMVDAGATLDELFQAGKLSTGKDGSHCTFCEIKTGCPAALQKAQEMAAIDFDDEPETIKLPGANYLAEVLPWVPFMDKWLKAVEGQAEKAMLAGGHIEDHKLIEGRASRDFSATVEVEDEIGDMEDVIFSEDMKVKLLKKEFGIPKKDLYTLPKFLTAPAVETLIKGRKGDVKKFNATMVTWKKGKLKVAHVSSPKAEVKVGDVGTDFDDVED